MTSAAYIHLLQGLPNLKKIGIYMKTDVCTDLLDAVRQSNAMCYSQFCSEEVCQAISDHILHDCPAPVDLVLRKHLASHNVVMNLMG